MQIKTEIVLTKEELVELIKEKYSIDGDIKFIIKEESHKAGMTDGVQHHGTRYVFDGVKITTISEKN